MSHKIALSAHEEMAVKKAIERARENYGQSVAEDYERIFATDPVFIFEHFRENKMI